MTLAARATRAAGRLVAAGRARQGRLGRWVRLVRARRGPRVAPTDGIAFVDGHVLVVPDPSTSALSRRLVDRGVTEPDFTDVARLVTRPGDVVLDVGASMGYFTILFASWAGPAGRVVAHEPWPSALRYLALNVARNRLANVEIDASALTDVAGRASMSPPSFQLRPGAATEPGGIDVVAARFDDIAAARGLDRLDIVKMDIEGAEGRALAGMTGTLERLRPVLLLEVHPDYLPRYGDDVAGIGRRLDALGYERILVEPDADETQGHHLVAGPPERLAAAGLLPGGPRRAVLEPDAGSWQPAPRSPVEVRPGAAGAEIRPTTPDRSGFAVETAGSWVRPRTDGRGAVRASWPAWIAWDGDVDPGLEASAWVFEHEGRTLARRRSIRLRPGEGAWRVVIGPATTTVRLAIEVRGAGAVRVRRLALEQSIG
ncbi:MAG TPA: FkbM family methyltransferase [Candidatus Limnocylindrales bacterium]|nr:FkbM family methyltransferase [Candidatus Limnocylindrales bacterium]